MPLSESLRLAMKQTILALCCLLSSAAAVYADTSSASLDAGILRNTLGTAVVPNGALLQVIVSPSGTFSAPTSSSYVTGDNILIGSYAMNSNGGAGETLQTVNFTLSATVVAGESVLLRFYPSLTLANMPTAPTLSTTYGQVRSSTIEFGGTKDPTETAWVVPSASKAVDFNYITSDNGGTAAYTPASADATQTVLIGVVVPEPSTYALLGCGFLGWVSSQRRRRVSAKHA